MIAQQSPISQRTVIGGMDDLLKAVAVYKRRDPTSADESEAMANLFNTLCATLMLPDGQRVFAEAEGLQLMLIIVR